MGANTIQVPLQTPGFKHTPPAHKRTLTLRTWPRKKAQIWGLTPPGPAFRSSVLCLNRVFLLEGVLFRGHIPPVCTATTQPMQPESCWRSSTAVSHRGLPRHSQHFPILHGRLKFLNVKKSGGKYHLGLFLV